MQPGWLHDGFSRDTGCQGVLLVGDPPCWQSSFDPYTRKRLLKSLHVIPGKVKRKMSSAAIRKMSSCSLPCLKLHDGEAASEMPK